MNSLSPWLWLPHPVAEAPFLCIVIPCAGSSAQAYRSWSRVIPQDFELAIVQRPGRMDRRDEEPPTDLFSILEPLAAAINGQAAGRPVLLVGHSLGALIAYELAAGGYVRNLKALVPVAMEAPQLLAGVTTSVKPMDDLQFANYMADHYHGIPDQLLAEPALLRMFLPPLRADMIMFEDYRYQAHSRLACPILALSGDADTLAPSPCMDGWQELTAAAFSHHILSGDHFFPTKNPGLIMPWLQKLI